MGFSETVVLLMVYSGLMLFFLIPFQPVQSKNYERNQLSFKSIFKDNLIELIFHKKAIFAFVLLGFMVITIWLGYAGAEWHYNAHSGLPPVSNESEALYSISGAVLYTVVLVLFVGYVRTLRVRNKGNLK